MSILLKNINANIWEKILKYSIKLYKKHMSWEEVELILRIQGFFTFFDQTRSWIHHISRIKGNLFDCLNRCIETFRKMQYLCMIKLPSKSKSMKLP